jgi:hypothetical protein
MSRSCAYLIQISSMWDFPLPMPGYDDLLNFASLQLAPFQWNFPQKYCKIVRTLPLRILYSSPENRSERSLFNSPTGDLLCVKKKTLRSTSSFPFQLLFTAFSYEYADEFSNLSTINIPISKCLKLSSRQLQCNLTDRDHKSYGFGALRGKDPFGPPFPFDLWIELVFLQAAC